MKKRKFVEVFYDPALNNWDAVIKVELRRRGLKHGDVTFLAKPKTDRTK